MRYFDRSKFLQEYNQHISNSILNKLNEVVPIYQELELGEFDKKVLDIICQSDWRRQLENKLNSDLEADLDKTGFRNSKLRESMMADAKQHHAAILDQIAQKISRLHNLIPEAFAIDDQGKIVEDESWIKELEKEHTYEVNSELTQLIETFEQDFNKIKSMLPSRFPMIKDDRSKPGLMFIDNNKIEIDRSILKRL